MFLHLQIKNMQKLTRTSLAAVIGDCIADSHSSPFKGSNVFMDKPIR